MKGGPFGAIQRVSKSLIVPKKSGALGGSLVCFRGSGRLFVFIFVLDALLRLELLRFDVVEQMNKKVDLSCLKNYPL